MLRRELHEQRGIARHRSIEFNQGLVAVLFVLWFLYLAWPRSEERAPRSVVPDPATHLQWRLSEPLLSGDTEAHDTWLTAYDAERHAQEDARWRAQRQERLLVQVLALAPSGWPSRSDGSSGCGRSRWWWACTGCSSGASPSTGRRCARSTSSRA